MKWSRLLLLLFLVVAFATTALAQTPSQFLTVYTIKVRPGADSQFTEYITKIKEGAEKVGAPQQWSTAQLSFGGPGNTYIIALPFSEWGEIDSWNAVPQMLGEAFGEEEAAKILRSGGSSIAGSETAVYSLLEDLSYNVAANAPASMYQIRISQVKRDRQQDYRVFWQRLNEAYEKAGVSRTVIRRSSALGATSVYVSATPLQKWSDRDGTGNVWEMIEAAHGEMEARRLEDSVNSSVVSSQVFVLTVRPELSRMPASPTSDD